jgi:ATP-dependent protease HslVU (ClpYQ) peptidase subunit
MLKMLSATDVSTRLEVLEKRIQANKEHATKKEREELLDWLSKDDYLRKHRHV